MKTKLISVVVAAVLSAAFADTPRQGVAKTFPKDAEYDRTVRRGGEDGRPYWNRHAIMFMYPPAFEFKKVEQAVKYRFDVLDDRHVLHSFTADSSEADLRPVWPELPAGYVTVRVTGVGKDGRDLALAGERTFWRKAPFLKGTYPKAQYGYAECARMIYACLYKSEASQYVLKNGKMIEALESRYPTKQMSALVQGMIRYAMVCPERRDEALAMAHKAADFLYSLREPAGSKYPGFTPTYHPVKAASQYEWPRRRVSMNVYPASAASAFAALYEETHEEKYLTAAKDIADTYLAFQAEDGTWPLQVDLDKGPVGSNKLVPISVMSMFERMFRLTKDAKYRAAGDRAFATIEKTRITSWNWEGQFEDVQPSSAYRNLTKHDACATAIYLADRYPDDKERLALARELLRFAEDQFVNWERPYAPGRAPVKEQYNGGLYNHFWDQDLWICPSVLEQYGCFTPIDSSAAKLINTYLALYRAEGNPTDLAKARALGDTATRCTLPDGHEATWWTEGKLRGDTWPNCMFGTAAALLNLAKYEDNERK